MKTTLQILSIFLTFSLCAGILFTTGKGQAATPQGKKAILLVSFGTTYADARKLNIESVEDKVRVAFPDYNVRRAFTSRIIIKKLADRDGIQVDTEKQALDKLRDEGYTEVIVQPLHVVPGEEYDKVVRLVEQYTQNKSFAKITCGRPVLYFFGQEDRPDDYLTAIAAIRTQLPKQNPHEAVVFMGHGGHHPANTAYAALQMKILDAKLKNVFVFTVEGYPAWENVMDRLKENKITKVTLMPFMLVAGDHASNDMAGEEKDSAKSQLLQAGFKVETYFHGLGENPGIQDIYVQHVKDAMDDKYDKSQRSKDRPTIPVIE